MYGSLAEADIYFDDNDLSETWDTFSDTQKIKALNLATKQIDRFPLHGEKYDDTQDNEFPRLYYNDGYKYYWNNNKDTGIIEVPENIKEATYIQAKFLLEYKDSNRIKAQKEGVTSLSVGSTSESYNLTKLGVIQNLNRASYNIITRYLLRFV